MVLPLGTLAHINKIGGKKRGGDAYGVELVSKLLRVSLRDDRPR